MPASRASGEVVRITRCDLRVSDEIWQRPLTHRAEIDRHWAEQTADNPKIFNGPIFLMRSHTLAGGTLAGRFVRTDFKTYLYWRDLGMPDWGVTDAFGSALIRSAEGHVLLGRQSEGHVNAGLAYPPGGFIDARDVAADGSIDLVAAIGRELAEETGLDPAALARAPGFIATFSGPQISIAAEFRSPLGAAALEVEILAHIAAETDPELAGVVVVRSASDLGAIATPHHTHLLLEAVLGA